MRWLGGLWLGARVAGGEEGEGAGLKTGGYGVCNGEMDLLTTPCTAHSTARSNLAAPRAPWEEAVPAGERNPTLTRYLYLFREFRYNGRRRKTGVIKR